MKARPILFSGSMVRALLAGRKTQTRRVIKLRNWAGEIGERDDGSPWPWCEDVHAPGCDYWYPAPGGEVGDLMWVRETWLDAGQGVALYAATECSTAAHDLPRRPSIFMPRRASRITLRITDVRVQRIQDISEDDARAEGVQGNAGGAWGCEGLIEDFAALWYSINGPGAWGANPWVWAYTFEVLRENVDAVLERGAA